MSKFSCNEVELYIQSITNDVKEILNKIENKLVDARDHEKESERLPISLTKRRIKTASSTYLKTKRKVYNDLAEITDYGGLRVLCLFEQNIMPAHKFIIKNLVCDDDLKLTLKEFKTFNWDTSQRNKLTKVVEVEKFDDVEIDHPEVPSGYKSIHYVVDCHMLTGKKFSIEIQLRTILQNAWSELEHSISYKQGSIHPHIKKSFKFFARDLETSDALITHLVDISNHEHLAEQKQLEKFGPHQVFSYDPDIDSDAFLKNSNLQKLRGKYEKLVEKNYMETDKKWITKARDLIDNICDDITVSEIKNDKKLAYWVDMERAYLLFQEGKYKETVKAYEEIIESGNSNTDQGYDSLLTHITYFRLGESLLKTGDKVAALSAFDHSERICEVLNKASDRKISELDIYHIKNKLALIYWQLGSEFFHIALEEIEEAESQYELIKDSFRKVEGQPSEHSKLLNNLCWYNLEMYLKNNDIVYLDKANEYYDKLSGIISSGETVTANSYDTCAWFCYQKYKERSNDSKTSETWLSKSREYCSEILNKTPDVSTGILNVATQRTHYLQIMSEEDISN